MKLPDSPIKMTILVVGIVVLVAAVLYFAVMTLGHDELLDEGEVEAMRIEKGFGTLYLIQIHGKEYSVMSDDYERTSVGDYIQLWDKPGASVPVVVIIEEATP